MTPPPSDDDFASTASGGLPGAEGRPRALKGQASLHGTQLQAISPQEIASSHASALDLPHALIMMVDDEPLNIEMTEAFLQEAGYSRFVSTDDSRQAMPLMRRHAPSVVLLDLSMPHVSGMEILEALSTDRELRRIPVIVLTATNETDVKLKALSLGAVDFLAKPVDPSELALRMRNTLVATAYRDYLAHHDPMTGLPNKLRYYKDTAGLVAAAVRAGHRGALVHIGVDGLGAINDALGRAIGDQVLQRLAKQFASVVATETGGELSSGEFEPALYRFDGDEFAIAVPFFQTQEIAAGFISRLMEEAVCAMRRAGRDLFVTCSIGISVFPDDGTETAELMTKASLALRTAKQSGPHSYGFYAPGAQRQAQSRLGLAAELRRGFARDEVTLVYHPRLDAGRQELVGAEVFPAWKTADGEPLAGEELLDLAAQTEVGKLLLEWTLERTTRAVTHWMAARLEPVPVSVSLSMAHSTVADLAGAVWRCAGNGAVLPLLTINLQDLAVSHVEAASDRAILAELRAKGVRLSLARVGADDVPLSLLRLVAFDEVRPDGKLVAAAAADARAADLVKGVSQLARAMSARCVAPNIATARAWNAVKSAGVDQYYGPVAGPGHSALEFARLRLKVRAGR
jgi:diguanylate cyclase (GGDEF)-like protein